MMTSSFPSLFEQAVHLQLLSHKNPALKHSQYCFIHLLQEQVQGGGAKNESRDFYLSGIYCISRYSSSSLAIILRPRPLDLVGWICSSSIFSADISYSSYEFFSDCKS